MSCAVKDILTYPNEYKVVFDGWKARQCYHIILKEIPNKDIVHATKYFSTVW